MGIVGGSGTLNRVAKWTPDGFNIGNSLTWDDGSRVRTGLGLTFTDNNTLTLINTAATGNNAVLSFQGNSGLGNASGIYLEDATNQTHITTGNYDAVNGTKVVTVDGNLLNVGIGTNTPGGVKLNVHNSGSSFALTKYTNTGTGQSTFTDGFVVGQNSSTGVGSILLWNLENTDIEVGTNSSTRMWIKNNGFVGIGTSTPVGQLHVDGNGTATTVTPTWINYTPNSYFRNTAPSNDNKVGGLGFADGSTGNFNEGLTGIAGGTASGANIGVVGLAGETATGFNIGLFAQVANGSSGNYGVYSLAPANATSWAGAFVGRVQIADGTQGLGRIFTSDAGGTGSWQTPAAAGLVSGSGTLNFIPKWTPNGTTLGNSLLQDNGNAVKLGNSAFYNGNSLNIYPTPTSSEPALLIGDGQVGGFYLEQATGNLHITLNGANIPSGNHVMTFDDNNLSVGIGTTTPVARLHVENTASNIGGVRVYQPNENNIPGLKSLTGGTISNDLSVFSAWGRNSIYAQRGDFTSGGMIVLGSGDAILGTGFGTNNAIQGNAQDGNAITGTIFLGTGTALRGFAPGSNALALHTTGNVRLQGIGESNGYVLTSDAAGNATWQGPVGIQLANMSASVNIPFAYTPITQWQTIVYEDGGANYNPVTGEYTVPVSGVYSITSNLGFFQVASNGYSSLLVYVNGAQIIDSRESAVANTFPGSKVSITRRLNAGDRISIWSYANGATFNTINSGDFCTLSIKLINR